MIARITVKRFLIDAVGAVTIVLMCGINTSHANGGLKVNTDSSNRFYIDIGEKQKTELIRKAKSLKPGVTVSSVKSVLGEPTSDEKLIGKKGEFRARQLTYYIRKRNKSTVNEIHDRYLATYFDEADKLKGVRYKLSQGTETEAAP